jgi:hypothetical protein
MAAVKYTFTHKQYTEYTEWNTHNNKKNEKIGKYGPCPICASYTLSFALQLRKKNGKTSVRVVEKCPVTTVADITFLAYFTALSLAGVMQHLVVG